MWARYSARKDFFRLENRRPFIGARLGKNIYDVKCFKSVIYSAFAYFRLLTEDKEIIAKKKKKIWRTKMKKYCIEKSSLIPNQKRISATDNKLFNKLWK